MRVPVLYRDDRIVVVSKPAGMLVHRSSLDRHESIFLLQVLRDQLGCSVHPVHRLDKPTSGIMLLAFDRAACTKLSESFERGQVDKRYLAVVRGWIASAGIVDHPLARLRDDPGHRTCIAHAPDEAKTRYRGLATAELPFQNDRYPTSRYSLVSLAPLTGRRHQLRRHLKHLAHPIVGDTTYGKGLHNRAFLEHFGCARLLLAATWLEFPHPTDGHRCSVRSPVADDFRAVMDALGWSEPSCDIDPCPPDCDEERAGRQFTSEIGAA